MARMGEIIDGKYEVLREVGRGGMSVVYLAMDKRLNKQWAIKEFRKDKDDAGKQVALKALLDEANLMKKLDHPTLPRIVDIIDDRQTVYVVMDYIEGESLNKVLDAYGAQPQEAVIEWAKQISEVLDYLHTQSPPVIYRDMKPANIMLKPDGTVRLIDFGIAREYKEGKDGDTEAIGTRGYAAPEQFGGKGQTDARTDIYSLGVTLYHLVTGKNPAEPPYEIYPIRHWNPGLSSGLEWLIQKCTQLNPNDRYQSCAEVTYVLENLDKFEGAYKRKQRSRINLFVASVIMTIVFIISSVGCLVGANYVKSSSYDTLVAEESYVEAIAVDDQRPEAYVGLAKQIMENTSAIDADVGRTDATKPGVSVAVGDLKAWLESDVMEDDIKTQYPAVYARVQFELGFLDWTNKNADDTATALAEALPHFEKVIEIAMNYSENTDPETAYADMENGMYAGLEKNEYNLALSLYRVADLYVMRDTFDKDDADRIRELTPVEEFAGIKVGEDESVYSALFSTYKTLLDDLHDIPGFEKAKLSILDRIAYILRENENCKVFSEIASIEEMVSFLTSYAEVLEEISNTNEDKAVVMKSINQTIELLNAQYKGADPYNEKALEAIS